jgi:hypothetical protein
LSTVAPASLQGAVGHRDAHRVDGRSALANKEDADDVETLRRCCRVLDAPYWRSDCIAFDVLDDVRTRSQACRRLSRPRDAPSPWGPDDVTPQTLERSRSSVPAYHSKGLHVACHRSDTRWLTGTSTIHNRVEVGFGLGTTTAALEVGSLLDRKRHVVDVAVNLR